MSTILLQDQQNLLTIPEKTLVAFIEAVLSELSLSDRELSVVLCDNAAIADLNEQFLGRVGPTNVLSFPQSDDDDPNSDPEGERMLGDVVVSVERAISDAQEADADPYLETAFLLIHGILHLAGYDHEGEMENQAGLMEAMEDKLFAGFGNMLKS